MRALLFLLGFLMACWGSDAYIVEGTVVEVSGVRTVVIDHKAIEGLMPEMVMDFEVKSPEMLTDVRPGDRIIGRLILGKRGSFLTKLRVVGKGMIPKVERPASEILLTGQTLPRVEVATYDGPSTVLGEGQGKRTLLTFVYTRCPLPDYCPAVIGKLQPIAAALPEGSRILVVTLDPEYDTVAVLSDYAKTVGAIAPGWTFGRVSKDDLKRLASASGLGIKVENDTILHGIRYLVLSPEGALIERYDDSKWPMERVLEQLKTGEPLAPLGSTGTITYL
jgi:protein SCO1/2